MSGRFFASIISLAALAFAMAPIGAAAAPPVHLAPCLDGGFAVVAQADGTGFANTGDCVSYAARGGTLFRKLDASSVFTGLRGAGGPPGTPDANGDSTGGSFDAGVITGAFSGATADGFNFVMFFNYVLHRPTGVANGTGTASCNPCLVGGLTGTVGFATTLVGHGIVVNGMTFVAYDGGTWQINSAAGQLAAISGSGTWTEGLNHTRPFAGTILLPI